MQYMTEKVAEGGDTTFLLDSQFTKECGLKPQAVYRNLAPAELYEMVSTFVILDIYHNCLPGPGLCLCHI